MLPIIRADWPAPSHVHAFTTTRVGGVSLSPYDSLNVAEHVDDDVDHVIQNRQILREAMHLPSEPVWLSQAHTTMTVEASSFDSPPCADASFTREKGVVCVAQTADCLPVLVCDMKGTVVSAIHAGWKGLAMGIVPLTLDKLGIPPADTLVWLGPAIGPDKFEVRDDVRDLFLSQGTALAIHFKPFKDRYLCDMYAIARFQCGERGITQVFGGDLCTFSDPARFYSYRRDGRTGRMGTVIFLAS